MEFLFVDNDITPELSAKLLYYHYDPRMRPGSGHWTDRRSTGDGVAAGDASGHWPATGTLVAPGQTVALSDW